MSDLNELSAVEAARRIADGAVTSEDLVAACLARIEAREDAVGAWQYLDADAALAEARTRDGEAPKGPLHGLPVGVKDLIDTADMPTTYGSPIYADHRPTADAPCVVALRAAGAVILGKTVTTEFAVFKPGKTRNPHDLARTPGGSSSGSAAAVVDRMIPLALGTQTAGSVIRPAAFCGAVGYKPSFGAIDMDGIKDDAPALDTLGVFARSVADAALLAQAMALPGTGLAAVDAGALDGDAPRVGLCRTPQWDRAEAAQRSALEDLCERLAAAGAEVDEAPTPPDFDGLADAQDDVMWAGLARSLAPERCDHADLLSDLLRQKIDAGAALAPERVAAAEALAVTCRDQLDALFGERDVIIAPPSPGEAPDAATTGDPLFNRMWNLLRVPALTLPVAKGPAGLPIGAHILARPGDETVLLRAAHWIERACGPI
jgi:amidase